MPSPYPLPEGEERVRSHGGEGNPLFQKNPMQQFQRNVPDLLQSAQEQLGVGFRRVEIVDQLLHRLDWRKRRHRFAQ
jgi:hypothetical protein